MKNIFRNNQVIITSLAIMIAIAGYLNFTNENVENVGVTSEYFQAEGDFKAGESINRKDEIKNNKKENTKESTKDVLNNKNKSKEEIIISEGNVEDESKLVEVSSNEEGTEVGEAVMVNSTATVNYFYNVKLNREQTRAKNKEELIEVVENTAISEDKKEEAVNKIIELTANAERENSAEMMLKARGFENSVVSIVDGKVDVIVDSKMITEEEVAQIVDIVNRKTGIENKNIVVTPVNSK